MAPDPLAERTSSPFREARPPEAPPALGLRPLTGYEEEYVEAHQAEANSSRLCNHVLAHCLVAPGEDPGPQLARVRRLVIAERDRALVRLRQMSLGDRLDTQVDCPRCGVTNQVDFRLSSLPLDFAPPPGQIELTLEDGRHAALRLPTAGDQEELLDAGLDSAAARRTWLLARLLVRLGDWQAPFDEAFARGLPARARRELEQAMEAQGAFLDLRMTVQCRGCGHAFSSAFDVAAFFFELKEHGWRLLREVHQLARAYHWSQAEILSLNPRRRLQYLLLIEEERDARLTENLRG